MWDIAATTAQGQRILNKHLTGCSSKAVVLKIFLLSLFVSPEKNMMDFNYPFQKKKNYSLQSITSQTKQNNVMICFQMSINNLINGKADAAFLLSISRT